MEFMAIEVLQGHTHTYRHDLESFLYTSFYGPSFAMTPKAMRGVWQGTANFAAGTQETMESLLMQREAIWINTDSDLSFTNFLTGSIVAMNSLRSFAWPCFQSEMGAFTQEFWLIPRKYTNLWSMHSTNQSTRLGRKQNEVNLLCSAHPHISELFFSEVMDICFPHDNSLEPLFQTVGQMAVGQEGMRSCSRARILDHSCTYIP